MVSLTQLECSLPKALGEALFNFLEEDALSVSLNEETLEQWQLLIIINPLAETPIRQKITSFLQDHLRSIPPITTRVLAPTDWVKAVHQDLHPLTIGRFYVYGSHAQENPPADLLPLQIDAATAFGSGHHESTEGCLKALSLLAKQSSFQKPLDMGCGSGVLAMAMARLWKVLVLACDNDPEAVRVTTENAHLNHLDTLIKAQVSDGFTGLPMRNFDIITANILAGPLCHMAQEALDVLTPGGAIVLAGLLNRQAEDVIDAYRSAGAKLVEQLFIGEWSTLIMRKTE